MTSDRLDLGCSQVEIEHSSTLRALALSHQAQMARLSTQLEEERRRSNAMMHQVAALQRGLDLDDDIIATLCLAENLS